MIKWFRRHILPSAPNGEAVAAAVAEKREREEAHAIGAARATSAFYANLLDRLLEKEEAIVTETRLAIVQHRLAVAGDKHGK